MFFSGEQNIGFIDYICVYLNSCEYGAFPLLRDDQLYQCARYIINIVATWSLGCLVWINQIHWQHVITIKKMFFVISQIKHHIPANKRRWPNVVLMLGWRQRRWANIKTTLGQRLVFAGMYIISGLFFKFKRVKNLKCKKAKDFLFFLFTYSLVLMNIFVGSW